VRKKKEVSKRRQGKLPNQMGMLGSKPTWGAGLRRGKDKRGAGGGNKGSRFRKSRSTTFRKNKGLKQKGE